MTVSSPSVDIPSVDIDPLHAAAAVAPPILAPPNLSPNPISAVPRDKLVDTISDAVPISGTIPDPVAQVTSHAYFVFIACVCVHSSRAYPGLVTVNRVRIAGPHVCGARGVRYTTPFARIRVSASFDSGQYRLLMTGFIV